MNGWVSRLVEGITLQERINNESLRKGVESRNQQRPSILRAIRISELHHLSLDVMQRCIYPSSRLLRPIEDCYWVSCGCLGSRMIGSRLGETLWTTGFSTGGVLENPYQLAIPSRLRSFRRPASYPYVCKMGETLLTTGFSTGRVLENAYGLLDRRTRPSSTRLAAPTLGKRCGKTLCRPGFSSGRVLENGYE